MGAAVGSIMATIITIHMASNKEKGAFKSRRIATSPSARGDARERVGQRVVFLFLIVHVDAESDEAAAASFTEEALSTCSLTGMLP